MNADLTPMDTDLAPGSTNLTPAERIIVALDCDARRAEELAYELQGLARWLKVGMTLFYQEGPRIVRRLKEQGYRVFVDLKLYDIPHQVRGAAQAVVACGADMLSIHASGGRAMMEAAQVGVLAGMEAAGVRRAEAPITLGITVLTSMDAETLASLGILDPTEKQVQRLAELARVAGLSGVVASPLEAQMLRSLLGPAAAIVTPGVRPRGSAQGDQTRIASPQAALKAGASHLVIGRPVTEADDPKAALSSIVSDIERELP